MLSQLEVGTLKMCLRKKLLSSLMHTTATTKFTDRYRFWLENRPLHERRERAGRGLGVHLSSATPNSGRPSLMRAAHKTTAQKRVLADRKCIPHRCADAQRNRLTKGL